MFQSPYYRLYSEDANEGNEYQAAPYTFELRDTGQYGFLLPPDQVYRYMH